MKKKGIRPEGNIGVVDVGVVESVVVNKIDGLSYHVYSISFAPLDCCSTTSSFGVFFY
jgi:hypothetical protein